ncbi:oligosaccharide flippase family protein [Mycoplasmatota bacterium]|nr:oligosaccharide flippase family protein [Mycoplasmatota bacterium]
MKLELKRITDTSLFKTASIYTFSHLLNKAIPFLLLPILTRYLSAEDYGIVSMFGVVVAILISFVGLNTHGAVARNYFDKSKENMKTYVTSTISILIFSISLISLIFIIGGRFIASLTSLPLIMLWVALIISIAQFVNSLTLVLWQVQRKATQYGLFNFAKSLMDVSLSIVLIVGMGFAWRGRIYAQLIASIVFLLVSIVLLRKNNWIGNKVKRDDLSDAFKFGLPLIPHIVGGILITMIDRFFITNYSGIAETGIYTVGYQVGAVINVFATSFNQAFSPWLYSKLKLDSVSIKIKIVKMTYIYFVAIIIMAIILTIAANILLPFIVGKQFQSSNIYVFWIALGYAFHGMYFMIVNYLFYIKKTNFIGLITLILAILNIVLNMIMVPIYGALGAAYATTIAYLLQFILVWILSARLYPMPWNPISLLKK